MFAATALDLDDLAFAAGIVLGQRCGGCVHEPAKLVSGHPQLDARVVGPEVNPNPISVDFQSVESIDPYGEASIRHFFATPHLSKCGVVSFGDVNVNRLGSVPLGALS